ncbi:hypothetical protein MSG28_015387 [Choristoneura fumiferana]|uniref:Uncharacterized protein n=1 Tax=Choristoneura fumiferana TaxID=7141 RepID=A0ACC0KA28_CHOFU|nr:hypothetical protein MSG28_015387 [Choristoneura fumiferana]
MVPNATETVLGSAREREDCDKLVAPQAAPRKHELAAVPVTLFTYWHISGLDTDADPHNATRGFFYSHVGWLLVKKHPEVLKRSRTIDMSDIYNNPVLRFQKIYGAQVILSCAYILPSLIPMLWGQSFSDSWHINSLRIILNLHASCLVNSAAHAFGNNHMTKT